MLLKRKIYSELLKWKEHSADGFALLIEGARRIGKSTIVEEFAKNEYKHYLLIDFAKATDRTKQYFSDYANDLDTLFMLLSQTYGKVLEPSETLIIFDEVQLCPKARQLIKQLVADGRYHYIETGSLISVKENIKDIVIPSEEKTIKMYPLDFEEFCWALNKDILVEYIRKCFNELKPLDEQLHREAFLVFKQYMLVGGMPKSVIKYIENNKRFDLADEVKRNILSLYRQDIRKIENKYQSKVTLIFDQIPSFLSKHEKRVILNDIKSSSTIEQYTESFFWLSDSMICNECFNCNDPNIGLSINEDRTYIKCYMGDTGLLVSHAFDENEIMEEELYKQILLDRLSINEGMLFENAIAQMLVSNGHKLYFYNPYSQEKHRNDIEIDFLISNKSKTKFKVYPIEVKSTIKYTVNSLLKFKEKFKDRIGQCYVIHPKNLVVKEDYIAIPPYMTICL